MKRASLILLYFFALSLCAEAQKQSNASGYCLMRVFDVNKFVSAGSYYMSAGIVITYETGEQERVELEPYSEKTEPENLKTITLTLNRLKKNGYLLMSANSTGDQGNIVTDYVLLKQF